MFANLNLELKEKNCERHLNEMVAIAKAMDDKKLGKELEDTLKKVKNKMKYFLNITKKLKNNEVSNGNLSTVLTETCAWQVDFVKNITRITDSFPDFRNQYLQILADLYPLFAQMVNLLFPPESKALESKNIEDKAQHTTNTILDRLGCTTALASRKPAKMQNDYLDLTQDDDLDDLAPDEIKKLYLENLGARSRDFNDDNKPDSKEVKEVKKAEPATSTQSRRKSF